MFIRRRRKSHLQQLDTAALLHAFYTTHQQQYIGELFNRYVHLIFANCNAILKNPEASKDASMQIFEKIAQKLKEQEVQYFEAWLYSVCRNHCINLLKKQAQYEAVKNRYKRINEEDAVNLQEEEVQWASFEAANELTEAVIQEAIKRLSPEQAQCIQLFYFKKKSYKEIAHKLQYDIKQVKSYLQNGKRKLKQIIQSEL